MYEVRSPYNIYVKNIQKSINYYFIIIEVTS